MPLFSVDTSKIKEFYIERDNGHRIYVAVHGSLEGKNPVIFAHGGPGGLSKTKNIGYFNSAQYDPIIIFDQRGCGKSTSVNFLQANTTPLLVEDMEAIRQKLNINKWVVVGNSWGTALALLYAQQYTQHVSGLVLRGTFLGVGNLLTNDSYSAMQQPEGWAEFKVNTQALLEKYNIKTSLFSEHSNTNYFVDVYYYLLMQDNFELRQQATAIYNRWVGHIYRAMPELLPMDPLPSKKEVDSVAMEMHYVKNNYFIAPNQILNNLARIADAKIPVAFVHGKHDKLCPPQKAIEFAMQLRSTCATHIDLVEAGHSGEDVTDDATVAATHWMTLRIAASAILLAGHSNRFIANECAVDATQPVVATSLCK